MRMYKLKSKYICLIVAVALTSSFLGGCQSNGSGSTAENNSISTTFDSTTGADSKLESTHLPTESSEESNEETAPNENDNFDINEYGMTDIQMNSYSMLYYLAITAEKVYESKDNKLILEDICTSLNNDINPGAVDTTTQEYLKSLKKVIYSFQDLSTKRERLTYIYNQNKATAIRSAIPNPLIVLSMTNSLDWKKFALNIAYSIVDSYTSYKNASGSADMEYLTSGWELDAEETDAIRRRRDDAFDYMVDIVREYQLDGLLTLSENDIKDYFDICEITNTRTKIERLENKKETYKLLGDYWLELADSYFNLDEPEYEKCLECIDEYKKLTTNLFRKDFNYAQILPEAIVAAQNVYEGKAYISKVSAFADQLVDNILDEDWSSRYFASQVYLDLYSRSENKNYLEKAYQCVRTNVINLLDEQKTLNSTYLADVQMVTAEEPEYDYMTKNEKEKQRTNIKKRRKELKSITNR